MFIHSTHCSISLNKKSNGLKKQKQLRVSNTYSTIEKLMSSQTYPKGYNQVSFITYYQVNKGQKKSSSKGDPEGERGTPLLLKRGARAKMINQSMPPLPPTPPLGNMCLLVHIHTSPVFFFFKHYTIQYHLNQIS